jgi:23S rRNA (cytosine1962-C5)-methyltransferase
MSYHALTLTAQTRARIEAGVRDLPIASVAGASEREAGQPVRLMSPQGEQIAIGLVDPENDYVRVYVVADEMYQALDARFFRGRVTRAWALRRGFGLERDKSAFRVLHGAGDDLPGLTADVYGDFAVVYAYSRGLLPFGKLCAEALREVVGVKGVVVKVRARDTAASQKFKQDVIGESPPEKLIVEADGARFEVHLLAALNVGLFTDMREHRVGLKRYVAGRRVLNEFAYTASLSVAAALAGAKSVTSVDLAGGVLAWAKENFTLNGLDPSKHRFIAEDMTAYLKRAAREGERFDLAIVDPPTVSASRAATWTMKRDYPELIERTVALLGEDALLWLSANARDLGNLVDIAKGAFETAKRDVQLLEVGSVPPDYPTRPAHPQDRYLQRTLFRIR